MGNNKKYVGEEFIDKLYKNLYMSEEVQHTKENKDKRLEAIKQNPDALVHVDEELLEEHPEIVLWAKEAQKATKKTKQRKLKPKKEDE